MISDNQGATTTAYFHLHINSPPVANDDTAITLEDQTITVQEVLDNDSDAESHALSITAVFNVIGGSASIINSGSAISVTPATNSSAPVSFSYSIADTYLATAQANALISVNSVNDPPTAVDDSFTINEDSSQTLEILANDLDIDGGVLSIASVNNVVGASVDISLDSTTVAVYPTLNSTSTITFDYTVEDGQGGSSVAGATVNIIPINDAPVATDDVTITNLNQSILLQVLLNDTDIESDSLTITSITTPSGGSASISTDASAISVTNHKLQ